MKSYYSIFIVVSSIVLYGCGSMPSPNKVTTNVNATQQARTSAELDMPASSGKSSSIKTVDQNYQNNLITHDADASTNSNVRSFSDTSVVVNNIEKERHSRILAAINTTDPVKTRSKNATSSTEKGQRENRSKTSTKKITQLQAPLKKQPIVVAKMKAVLPPSPNNKLSKAQASKPSFNEDLVKYNLANRYYQSGKYQNSIDVLESSRHDTSKNAKIRDLLVLAYTAYARELVSRADMLEAQTILEKAILMQPKNKTIRRQLRGVKNVREADRVYKIAVDAYNKGKNQSAFKSFARVLSLNPAHKKAKKYHSKIKAVVVDSYHKKALQYYRRQKLSKAITEWNSLLKVDPANDLARIYRSRAIELQKKFEKL